MPPFKVRRWIKVCFGIASLLLLANTILGFIQMKRHGEHIFNSNHEMVLVLALLAVMLFAIAYKSQQNREHK